MMARLLRHQRLFLLMTSRHPDPASGSGLLWQWSSSVRETARLLDVRVASSSLSRTCAFGDKATTRATTSSNSPSGPTTSTSRPSGRDPDDEDEEEGDYDESMYRPGLPNKGGAIPKEGFNPYQVERDEIRELLLENRKPFSERTLDDETRAEVLRLLSIGSGLAEGGQAADLKLKSVVLEVHNWESRGFPMPETFGPEDWATLAKFEHEETRLKFLDKHGSTADDRARLVQSLLSLDAELGGPLRIPDDMVKRVCSSFGGGSPAKKVSGGRGSSKGFQRTTPVEDDDDRGGLGEILPCRSWLTKDGEVSEEVWAKIDRLKYEYEFMKQMGEHVFPEMTDLELADLLSQDSRKGVAGIFRFVAIRRYQTQVTELIRKRSRAARRSAKLRMEEQQRDVPGEKEHMRYGLGNNTLFLRFSEKKLEMAEEARTIREFHEWGQPLVIDLSFFKMMSVRQVKSLVFREIPFALKFNRESRVPFAVHFTSYDPECIKCQLLSQAMPRFLEPEFPALVSTQSYLDLFPPERLLYMTPDSKTDLMKYDPDDVYIIGGLIDASNKAPHTLSRAKQQGVRHARLPMRKVLGISPDLNVDHAVAVLAEFKNSGDWFYSFRWVPPRFFKNRLKSGFGYTPEMEAVYKAQLRLTPLEAFGEGGLSQMSPKVYRQRYREIMESLMPKNAADRKKFVKDFKYNTSNRQERQKRIYGFLDGP